MSINFTKLPKKAQKRIKETKETLKMYGTDFKDYMTNNCHREYFELGSEIKTHGQIGFICGWNRNCNYDVYIVEKDEICNVHPAEINKIEEEK